MLNRTSSLDSTVIDHNEPHADVCTVPYVHSDDVARARAFVAGDSTYRDLAGLFAALADPTRAKIVHILLDQELCTCDIAAVVRVSDSAVSQHLRVLRSLRLVKSRRAGKFVYYSLDDSHVALLIRLGLTHAEHPDNEAVSAGGATAPSSERRS